MSIVCVFNDPDVRRTCLDRSVEAGLADAPNTEYLPMDNTARQFPSAGAALNAGARLARHDVVVFVHQDVYLHSLPALERAAAALLDDPGIGLVGAAGVTPDGTAVGIVRDRVVMIGEPSEPARAVDSVDEVLFLVSRDRVLDQALSEHPDLAWHAYSVEYGARVRAQGLRVATADVMITHNSMTTNLDRLFDGHAYVADLYPALVPMQTLNGVVRARGQRQRWRTLLRRRRGAAIWLRESATAVRIARLLGTGIRQVPLVDIRLVIDDALEAIDAPAVSILNLDVPEAERAGWGVDGLERRGRAVEAHAGTVAEARSALGGEATGAVLVTGLRLGQLAELVPVLSRVDHLVGVARDTGAWILAGEGAAALRLTWRSWRNNAFAVPPRGGAQSRLVTAPGAR
ncbi:MAG TPA: glycosyltransferase [Actinotalea sp.]|nr:glycosyltransferase [Actinotalea sp.]